MNVSLEVDDEWQEVEEDHWPLGKGMKLKAIAGEQIISRSSRLKATAADQPLLTPPSPSPSSPL